MIFVTAGFDPNPPTSADIQLRSTQDLSFAQMNSTAAALALPMISEYMPTPKANFYFDFFIALPSDQDQGT